MTIIDLNLKTDLGKRIKITKTPVDQLYLIGCKGTLTNTFGNGGNGAIGLFLDKDVNGRDCINIGNDIEFEFTKDFY